MTRLAVHMRIHEGKQIHKCKYCGAEFLCDSHLKIHERVHTGERPFRCDDCGKGFSEAGKLNVHRLAHHKETNASSSVFTCDQCECQFPTQKQLTAHQLQHSHVGKESPLKMHERTSDTGESYDSGDQSPKATSDVKQEEITVTVNPFFTCDMCGKGFANHQRLFMHQYTHKGKMLPKCKYCGKDCATNSALKVHERFHTGERPYSCNYCDWSSVTLGNLRAHQLKRHPGKELARSKRNYFAPVVTPRTPTLQSPTQVSFVENDINKRFKCEYCGRGFRTSHHLREHRYIHVGKPYKCDHCGRAFVRAIQLQRHHQKSVCAAGQFRCHYCGQNYVNGAQLLEHLRLNHSNGLHKCKHCSKVFIYSASLKVHEKQHTEKEAPYESDEDGGKSTDEYSCYRCQESFSHPSGLAIHKCNDQSTEKALTCKDCGAVVKIGGTTLSNVFTVTNFSNIKCFINNHTMF